MTKYILDDDKMVRMYSDGVRIVDLERHFVVDRRTIYRHLRAKGVKMDRKVSTEWTPHEEMQLMDARRNNVTGREYEDWVPTRTKAACKGHLRKWGYNV